MTENEKAEFWEEGKDRLWKVIDNSTIEHVSINVTKEIQKIYMEYNKLKNKKEENEPIESEE